MLFGLFLVVLAVITLILCVLLHAGLFYELRIRISVTPTCPKKVAYSLHEGHYKNAGTAYKRLGDLVPHLELFGIFYDDPKKVAQEKLRCIVGCCLPDKVDSQLEETLKTGGYSMWTFPECKKAVITEFPVRSMVSYIVAPWRVYPALQKYFKEYKDGLTMGPVIELCREDHIRYIAPMEGSEGFFVPEVAMETTEPKKKL